MKKTPILVAIILLLLGVYLLIDTSSTRSNDIVPENTYSVQCGGMQVEIDNALQESDPFDLRAMRAAHETYTGSYAHPLEQLGIQNTKRLIINERILDDEGRSTYTYTAYAKKDVPISTGTISGKLISYTKTDQDYQPNSDCFISLKRRS